MNSRREGNEHVKAVALRSGRELTVLGKPPVIGELETKEVTQTSKNDKIEREQPQEKNYVQKETEAKD